MEVKITEAQSHQLAFKMISVGVVWELPTSCITSHVVGVRWGFSFFLSDAVATCSYQVKTTM